MDKEIPWCLSPVNCLFSMLALLNVLETTVAFKIKLFSNFLQFCWLLRVYQSLQFNSVVVSVFRSYILIWISNCLLILLCIFLVLLKIAWKMWSHRHRGFKTKNANNTQDVNFCVQSWAFELQILKVTKTKQTNRPWTQLPCDALALSFAMWSSGGVRLKDAIYGRFLQILIVCLPWKGVKWLKK